MSIDKVRPQEFNEHNESRGSDMDMLCLAV